MSKKKILTELEIKSSLKEDKDAVLKPSTLQQEQDLSFRSIQCAIILNKILRLAGLGGQQASGEKLQLREAERKPSSSGQFDVKYMMMVHVSLLSHSPSGKHASIHKR